MLSGNPSPDKFPGAQQTPTNGVPKNKNKNPTREGASNGASAFA
jgi:hypothetical protein